MRMCGLHHRFRFRYLCSRLRNQALAEGAFPPACRCARAARSRGRMLATMLEKGLRHSDPFQNKPRLSQRFSCSQASLKVG